MKHPYEIDMQELNERLDIMQSFYEDDDLLKIRKEDSLPAILALRLLKGMAEDIREMKNKRNELIDVVLKMDNLDEIEKTIQKHINALNQIKSNKLHRRYEELADREVSKKSW